MGLRTVDAGGLPIPCLGMGTWRMGERAADRAEEAASLRLGIGLGMGLIDTAEMYGDGATESFVGKSLKGVPRDSYTLVTKVCPQNAGRPAIFSSLDSSLKRLGTDHADIYLLHWRGPVPLAETVGCMAELVRRGKARRWGVSNLDVADMGELLAIPGGDGCCVDQVLYNVTSRGIEYDLMPWLRRHGIATMAYCPLAQAGSLRRMGGDAFESPVLKAIAEGHGATVAQVMLAFTLRLGCVAAIPKASSPRHVAENRAAAELRLTDSDLAAIDGAFWPPTAKMHLDME
ncbi:MAG: aldo/keto reductase [Oscillospiraceae bacterium]|nr:aldo/keto reductase [Oscillospiraceae bacterium]